jgi:hypothetical protein
MISEPGRGIDNGIHCLDKTPPQARCLTFRWGSREIDGQQCNVLNFNPTLQILDARIQILWGPARDGFPHFMKVLFDPGIRCHRHFKGTSVIEVKTTVEISEDLGKVTDARRTVKKVRLCRGSGNKKPRQIERT